MGTSSNLNKNRTTRRGMFIEAWPLAMLLAIMAAGTDAEAAITCDQTITARVVVFDNPTVFNRLGAQNPNWITYALKRDVVAVDPNTRLPTGDIPGMNLTAGNVELRPDKRPRPLVIRSIEGACLDIEFTNLLASEANPNNAQQDNLINNDQVKGRCAGFHATGAELRTSMTDDGSMVGSNPGANLDENACGDGLVAWRPLPTQRRVSRWCFRTAPRQGPTRSWAPSTTCCRRLMRSSE